MKTLEYKVVELSTVTDKDIEDAINSVVKDGWNFDGIQFAMRDSSKRPSMAFLVFTKGGGLPDPRREAQCNGKREKN